MKDEIVDGMVCSRVEDTINASQETIVEVLRDYDLRFAWDPMFSKYEVYDIITENIKIVRQEFKGAAGIVSPRDFLMLIAGIEREGKFYIIGKSIDDDLKFPHKKNVIRGIIELGGYVLQKID